MARKRPADESGRMWRMLRDRRALISLVLLVVNVCLLVTVAALHGMVLGALTSVVAVIVLTMNLTTRMHALQVQEFREGLGRLPRDVRLTRDAVTQEVTALVTLVSGEPLVLRVPDEVADDGPQAASEWVIRTLVGEDAEWLSDHPDE